jgi:hypothetical protein
VSNEKRSIPNSFSYVILKGKSEHVKEEIRREAGSKSDCEQAMPHSLIGNRTS